MSRLQVLLVPLVALCLCCHHVDAQSPDKNSNHKQTILAHYMPWFMAKPTSDRWGWHWTMNAFNPEKIVDEKPEIAAHLHPLIGPYDSADPHVLEYQLLTMRLAGISGVIVDWYGLKDHNDYAMLHKNTLKLVDQIERLGMKFAICYEDQTIPVLVKAGRILEEERVNHAAKEIQWMTENWFELASYVKLDQKPLLLSFGQTGLTDPEWTRCLAEFKTPVCYLSLHHRRPSAVGAFDWPIPADALKAYERFQKESRDWPTAIPVAFPRFVDIYAEAKIGPSYGRVDDDQGKSFRMMLENGLKSGSPIVQIATWNDWGEGTIIEPSHEYGYRDLETVQILVRKHINRQFSAKPADLRLPFQILEARRSSSANQSKLDEAVGHLNDNRPEQARKILEQL
ncbi:MAG: glycoside hydrolase family 71/99-like protein [Planctomycetaceae bacterium]